MFGIYLFTVIGTNFYAITVIHKRHLYNFSIDILLEDYNDIINWNNLMKNSGDFKKRKPFKFGFVEEFFMPDFYEKLYKTFPKIDDTWTISNDISKYQHYTTWYPDPTKKELVFLDGKIPKVGKEWMTLMKYAITDEFIEKFRQFSGIEVNKCKYLGYIGYKEGGFQLPHIHNDGPSTLIIMLYFSKGWQQGEPGGTYMASDMDESSIIFEPYNLDNSMALFHDGPKAAHGVRYITKNVVRQAFQICLENYSSLGWSGGKGRQNFLESLDSPKKK